MNTKNNQRFQDTEERIQSTLLALAKSTDIRKVTIRSICEAADINRSTFYAHYLDINDLVNKMGKEMMQDISRLLENQAVLLDSFLSEAGLIPMITYVKEHRDFFHIYLNQYRSYADENFSLLWKDFMKPYIQKQGITNENEMWYYFTFFKAGFLAVLGQWVRNECPESPIQLARILLRNLPLCPDV